MRADGTPALLVLALVRSATPDPGLDERVGQFRAELRSSLVPVSDGLAAYDVVPEANDRWTGGGIDHITFATAEERDAGASVIARARPGLPADPAVSFRAFAVVDNPVRPSPADGVHLFSSGGMAEGFDRAGWQARWRTHATLLAGTTSFSPYLRGYVQHHGVDAATAAQLGLDDTHGIAHMTYASVEDQATALSLPEYLDVLRPDEDEFVSRERGMRVRVVRVG